MNTRELGNLGERIACEYLVKKGYKILAKNYRISFGEIDIIARKKRKVFGRNDKTIYFVEVKTIFGSGADFFPEDRVDYKKQQKLIRLCQIWLGKNKFPDDYPHQIDIIGITVDQLTKKAQVYYFPDAFADS